MAWDPVWEQIFKERAEWGKYPPEELIRFIAKNYYKVADRKQVQILDLGSGIGSASWYIAREGFSVTAYDGSPTALSKLKTRLQSEGLEAKVGQGDICELPYPDNSFDCVVDLKCLMCNDYASAKTAIGEVFRVLKPGGKFFSSTPQTGSFGDGIGTPVGEGAFKNSEAGPFAGMGIVRFTNRSQIDSLYAPFKDISVDRVEFSINSDQNTIKLWSVIGVK